MSDLDHRAFGFFVALFCLCDSGCSFALVAGPPAHAAGHDYVHCTSNRAAPILDGVGTAIGAFSAVTSAENSRNDATGAVVFGAIALLYGASATYGFVVTHDCNVAQEGAARRRQDRYATSASPTSTENAVHHSDSR